MVGNLPSGDSKNQKLISLLDVMNIDYNEKSNRILRLASDSNRSRLPVLKQFKKKAILAEFRKVNHVLDQITSNDIDHSNQ